MSGELRGGGTLCCVVDLHSESQLCSLSHEDGVTDTAKKRHNSVKVLIKVVSRAGENLVKQSGTQLCDDSR